MRNVFELEIKDKLYINNQIFIVNIIIFYILTKLGKFIWKQEILCL